MNLDLDQLLKWLQWWVIILILLSEESFDWRMFQTWSKELTDLAELNVRRCHKEHDCHNTPEFKYSGQNLWLNTARGNNSQFQHIPTFITESVNAWYSEKNNATQEDVDKCCRVGPNPHFLTLVADKNNQVGCSIAQYTSNWGRETLIACNYAYTIIDSYKVYKTGPAASECTTGSNPSFRSLCSTNEPIDVNDLFSS